MMEDRPDYPCPCAVGDEVSAAGTLCVTNDAGGTTILENVGTMNLTVAKAFWDYETGWRFHGRASGPVLDEIRRQATTGYTPDHYRGKYPKNPQLAADAEKAMREFDPSKVYFSEHDLVAPSVRPR